MQCDFDDGFCPTYANVLQAIANISLASRGRLQAKDASGRTVGGGRCELGRLWRQSTILLT